MTDIVFLGTPDFAVESLKALCENGYNVKAVFTQPDRPKGRGNKLAFSPVKEYAISKNIPVFQPQKIRENPELLKSLEPDLMITAAFGQILSKENLESAKLGCINVHASLLPKYRGSSPIQWAVINGEKETGITTMLTDIGVDTGDILLQKKLEIGENETAGELFDRLASLGGETLIETLRLLEKGELKPKKQEESQATHFPMLDKKTAFIDFTKSAMEICNFVRGVNPWPVAWTVCGEDVIKVYSAHISDEKTGKSSGSIISADSKTGIKVACGNGEVIVLDIIQSAGTKIMDSKAFLLGHTLKADKMTNG